MIEPITVFQVRCDHHDHAENPDGGGLYRWDGDETTIWGSRDEALVSIRTEGRQATTAGTDPAGAPALSTRVSAPRAILTTDRPRGRSRVADGDARTARPQGVPAQGRALNRR